MKRTKIQMALAELAQVKSELQQRRTSDRSERAARAIAAAPCSQCPLLLEQLRRCTNERSYWQRLSTEAKDKHFAELVALVEKHEKKLDKAMMGAARSLEYSRGDVTRLREEKQKVADDLRTTTRSMKDYRKELVKEQNLNLKLTETAAASEAEIEALRQRVAELDKFKSEIEREIETSSEEGEDEDATGNDVEPDEPEEGLGVGCTGPSGVIHLGC